MGTCIPFPPRDDGGDLLGLFSVLFMQIHRIDAQAADKFSRGWYETKEFSPPARRKYLDGVCENLSQLWDKEKTPAFREFLHRRTSAQIIPFPKERRA